MTAAKTSEALSGYISALEENPEWIVEIATLIANADGQIDPDEERALIETLEGAFRSKLAPMVIRALVGEAIETIEAEGGEARARALAVKLRETGKHEAGVGLAQTIAESSGSIGEEEAALIALLGGE